LTCKGYKASCVLQMGGRLADLRADELIPQKIS